MVDWVPKTRLGHMVLNGEVTTMSEALATKLPLREPEIVDILLPDLQDEVIDLNMVQRMTDSGRRVRFAVTCIVGNGDGFIGDLPSRRQSTTASSTSSRSREDADPGSADAVLCTRSRSR